VTKGVAFWSSLLWAATAAAQVGSVPGPRWTSPPVSHGADLTGVTVQVGIGVDSSRLSPKLKAFVWAMRANGDRRCTIMDYTSGGAIGDVGGVVISSVGSACEVEGGDRIVLEMGYDDVGSGTDSVDFYGAGSDATYLAAAENPLADLGYSGWLGINAPLAFYPDTPSSRDEFTTTHHSRRPARMSHWQRAPRRRNACRGTGSPIRMRSGRRRQAGARCRLPRRP